MRVVLCGAKGAGILTQYLIKAVVANGQVNGRKMVVDTQHCTSEDIETNLTVFISIFYITVKIML